MMAPARFLRGAKPEQELSQKRITYLPWASLSLLVVGCVAESLPMYGVQNSRSFVSPCKERSCCTRKPTCLPRSKLKKVSLSAPVVQWWQHDAHQPSHNLCVYWFELEMPCTLLKPTEMPVTPTYWHIR